MGNAFGREPGREPAIPAPLRMTRKVVQLDDKQRLPQVHPRRNCLLKKLRQDRINDYLKMDKEFVDKRVSLKHYKAIESKEQSLVEVIQGSPLALAQIIELYNNGRVSVLFLILLLFKNAIVKMEGSSNAWYIPVLSIVDQTLLNTFSSVLIKLNGSKRIPRAVVGVLNNLIDDERLKIFKMEKRPTETFADIGGLAEQIRELKETPELYDEMGIKPPKGVILYGAPGTGKTLLAKAVANQTTATFLRVNGSELVQKLSGEGPKLVRQLFRAAEEYAPSIIFIDEIDAIGTKRYDKTSTCGGEREVQRTMLELLNQLDGFDTRGDVKV